MHFELLVSRASAGLVKAYKAALYYFAERGRLTSIARLDNETWAAHFCAPTSPQFSMFPPAVTMPTELNRPFAQLKFSPFGLLWWWAHSFYDAFIC